LRNSTNPAERDAAAVDAKKILGAGLEREFGTSEEMRKRVARDVEEFSAIPREFGSKRGADGPGVVQLSPTSQPLVVEESLLTAHRI
jgi:hypothetical protein